MTEPRWLTEVEQRAWLSLVAVVLVGLPEVQRTFRAHGLVHVEYAMLAGLSRRSGGMRLGDLAEAVNMSPSRLSHCAGAGTPSAGRSANGARR